MSSGKLLWRNQCAAIFTANGSDSVSLVVLAMLPFLVSTCRRVWDQAISPRCDYRKCNEGRNKAKGWRRCRGSMVPAHAGIPSHRGATTGSHMQCGRHGLVFDDAEYVMRRALRSEQSAQHND
jgi:hypothetical protein